GHGYAAGPVAPGSIAAASTNGPGQSRGSQPSVDPSGYDQPSADHQDGGTHTSHRREFGVAGPGQPGQPAGARPAPGQPPGPRWYRQPRWLAALAAVILVAAGLGIWAVLSGSGSHAKGATTMPSMSAKPKTTTSALMNALILANKSGDATGK